MRAVVAILVALAVSNAEPAGHLVQIDVSAVNARGQTVLDLKPGDFQLREEGAAQAVDGVRLVRGEPRLVAVFLDEYHVDASATSRVVRTACATNASPPRRRVAARSVRRSARNVR